LDEGGQGGNAPSRGPGFFAEITGGLREDLVITSEL